ncbi:MAG: ATP-dependent Clp protease ATP-binding subunit [Lachnospiraceae bacterium]
MKNNFTESAGQVLEYAKAQAKRMDHGYAGTEHILLGLSAINSVTKVVLEKYDVTEEKIIELISELIKPEGCIALKDADNLSPRVEKMLEQADCERERFHADKIGTQHMLIAIMKDGESDGAKLLNTMKVNLRKVYRDLLLAMGENPLKHKNDLSDSKEKTKKSMLEQYSRDLTDMAKRGMLDPVIGREREIGRVVQILSRRNKNNPCLIGEPGVGKTAIVEGLAKKIVEDDVPETIAGKRVLTLDLAAMIAGSKYRGEFEERIKKLIAEVKDDGNVLLFLDELHTIIGAGGAEGAIDASNILKPSLARGEIQLIGATTIEEYRKHIEKDAALERRFQPVKIEEPTDVQTLDILKGLRPNYETHHKVKITDAALLAAVNMSKRYINDRYLPDKAIDLIDEAASKAKLMKTIQPAELKKLSEEVNIMESQLEEAVLDGEFEFASELKKKLARKENKYNKAKKQWEDEKNNSVVSIGEEEIADVVSSITRIPVKRLAMEESKRLLELEKILHERVVGQNEAVESVAKAVRRGRVGLKDPKRPIGSFLFLGPTGVGKTELSKALAQAVFGDENAMIRVDMSEYMEKHTVSKLIGSPPGYVGYDEGGHLSEKIRRNPYSVILFDEIEKAHPDVFNVLLQVLDDGHITDSTGRKVDFKNTIIIMTSNAGASSIVEPKLLGFAAASDEQKNHEIMKSKVMEEVKRIFKPEFINRIDEMIVFHVLSKDEIGQIVDILMKQMNSYAGKQLGITITLTDSAKEYIVTQGYDSKFGARPLKRALQNKIEDPLAQKILEDGIKSGSEVVCDLVDGKIEFFVKSSLKTRKK